MKIIDDKEFKIIYKETKTDLNSIIHIFHKNNYAGLWFCLIQAWS